MKRYINLLPPEEQQQIKRLQLTAQVWSFGIRLVASILIMGIFLFAGRLILNRELDQIATRIAAGQAALDSLKDQAVKSDIESFNQNLANFTTLQKANTDWSPALVELARILPKDMTIDSLTITRQDGKVEVSGHAGSRESVLQFRENILASRHFVNINFPLSNLEKSRNLPWTYRFYLKK